jgi:hypothetical protein
MLSLENLSDALTDVKLACQAEKQRRHAAEVKACNPLDHPAWLTEEVYREKIQLRLAGITIPALASTLGLSEPYAAEIRAGRQRPPPRHWLSLARLAGAPQANNLAGPPPQWR